MSEILNSIRAMIRSSIVPDLIIGTVKEFDESNWTITVDLNSGGTIDEVTIQAVISEGDTGVYFEPKIGSKVLLGIINGRKENLTVLTYTDIVRLVVKASDVVELQGNTEGGLVKSSVVFSEIKDIKNSLNDLKTIFNQWIPAPGDGGAALKALLAQYGTPLSVPSNKSEFENEKVKHG